MTTDMSSIFHRFKSASRLTPALVEEMFCHLRNELRDDGFPEECRSGLHEYYDEQFKHLPYFLHHFAPFVAQVDNQLQPTQHQVRVLDLGCGTGIQAYLLAARGANVVGVDMNSLRVRAGQAAKSWFEEQFKSPLSVELIEGNAFEVLRGFSTSFDAIYTQFALAYMKPQGEMLKCIDAISNAGATFILQEFNSAGLYNRLIAKKDWFSFREYRQLEELGWERVSERFQWLFPKVVMKFDSMRHALGRVESALCRLPGAHHFSSSMNLVYRKRSN